MAERKQKKEDHHVQQKGIPLTTAKELPAGLYDLLHTSQLHKRLEKAGLLERAVWSDFAADARRLVATGTSNSPFTQILLHSLLWGAKRAGEGTLDHVHRFITSHQGVAHDVGSTGGVGAVACLCVKGSTGSKDVKLKTALAERSLSDGR